MLVMLAYAAKDRIKAGLQRTFSRVVQTHFPDRRWRILDLERAVEIGEDEFAVVGERREARVRGCSDRC